MKIKDPKRIENLEFRRATYLLPEDEWPKKPSYHIDYWYDNPYYYHKDDYELNERGDYYVKKTDDPAYQNFKIHKSCFEHKESCYAIASFDYDEHEDFYELHFIGDRPLELTEEERKVFWELIKYGNDILNNSKEEEDEYDE